MRETEINQLDVAFGVEKNVFGLQIAEGGWWVILGMNR
jgi:hypothetical protein